MNPARRSKISGGHTSKMKKHASHSMKGGKKMAKRRKNAMPAGLKRYWATHRRKNPRHAAKRHNPRKHYAYRALARRHYRRNPSIKRAGSTIRQVIPIAASVAVGVVGSRALANLALKNSSAYLRAGAQLVIGLVAGMLTKGMKMKGVSEGLMLGSFASALLTAADAATGGRYNLGDEYYYVPDNVSKYLPRMDGYTSPMRQLSGYVSPLNSGMSDIYNPARIYG
jgi:hypothetical protein